ncbi:hypothetical protein MNBD_NITROSPINAE01-1671 [hydrothermal vent metagenome]|uniref:DinB-like domain-containing protein n=1 Tax=hydrothermal vent metagenome TaxID=652676 RepID=A0A3B1BAC5_9ZZZZ
MSILDPYYLKQEEVVNHLAQAAEQIPEDKIMWKPTEKALTWLFLIHHTSTHRDLFLKLFKGESIDFPGCYRDPANQARSGAESAQIMRKTWEDLKSFLQSQPDDYAKTVIEKPPWGGPPMTVEQLVWWTYEENVHHRGQAWVYARMNGLIPPTIWGTEDLK